MVKHDFTMRPRDNLVVGGETQISLTIPHNQSPPLPPRASSWSRGGYKLIYYNKVLNPYSPHPTQQELALGLVVNISLTTMIY